jgi:hypothetical protein
MSVAENAAGGIKSGVLLPLVLFLLFLAGAAMIAAGAFLVKSCGKKDQKVRFVPARMAGGVILMTVGSGVVVYFGLIFFSLIGLT